MTSENKPNFFTTFASSPSPGVTKYARLRNALLKAIENGHWMPGEKLPTELDLTKTTPFGLGTVQRALRELAEEGIIVRHQGHGSFVTAPKRPLIQPWHCRFLNDGGTEFLPVFPKILSRARIREYGPWSVFLEQDGDNIIRIDRKISINHEFSVLSRFYANADKFRILLEKSLPELENANLKLLLNLKFNLPITIVSQNLRMIEFPPVVCRELSIKKATSGLYIEAIASAGRTVHMYYQELFIPPNNRTLRIVENSPLGDPA